MERASGEPGSPGLLRTMMQEHMDGLALDVLDVARQTLMVNFRFLNRALWKMPFESTGGVIVLATDARTLYFNAEEVVRRYRMDSNEVVRDVLHTVFHCVFYHPLVGERVEQGPWDLACDMVAETAALSLVQDRFPCALDDRRRAAVERYREQLGNLSTEKLYRAIRAEGMDDVALSRAKALFMRDDHIPWYEEEDVEHETVHDEDGGDAEGASSDAREAPEDGEGDDAGERDVPEGVDAQQDGDGDADAGLEQQWREISEQLTAQMESEAAQSDGGADDALEQLRAANRRRYDYRDFLRRFSELGEAVKVSDDEFDLVFYSYGMSVYGNMPLVEPLEYRDVRRVREFVVAIDTSGSVQGRLVQAFVKETFDILKSTESFFERVRVHILQCDDRVRSDVCVTSAEEVDEYLERFELKGLGNTDFRPVFEYVDGLVESGELFDPRGLVYFTDGYGTYPASAPAYETAFVFVDDAPGAYTVPLWAYRLVLATEDLEELEEGKSGPAGTASEDGV